MISRGQSPLRLVLIGAGHTHLGVLKSIGLKPIPGVQLTVINPQESALYSGMLPGVIAGHYSISDAHIDLRPLAAYAGAKLLLNEATGIDFASSNVICRDGPPIPFDLLSINIGSSSGGRDVAGAVEHAISFKPIHSFLSRFDIVRQRVLAENGRARIGVVGAGAGGVELILAMQYRLGKELAAIGADTSQLRFTLFSATPTILPSFPRAMQRRFQILAQSRGILVECGRRVNLVEAGAVQLEGGESIPLDHFFWVGDAQPARWLPDTGLALDADGFIRVQPTLQSVSHPNVFVAGDIASIEGYDLPRSGVFAVREARPLAENLCRAASGKPLIEYRPQGSALYLVTGGDQFAVGTRNGVTFAGKWVWWLKDWIDRRFATQFDEASLLPPKPSH